MFIHSRVLSRTLGYTLIELMVVIAIMATLAVFVLPSLSELGHNQDLDGGANQVQVALRTAQSNALSGIKCGDNISPTQVALSWQVIFTKDSSNFNLQANCSDGTSLPNDSYTLPKGVTVVNVYISYLPSYPGPSCGAWGTGNKSRITFANISGALQFPDAVSSTNNCTVDQTTEFVVVVQSSLDKEAILITPAGVISTSSNIPAPPS